MWRTPTSMRSMTALPKAGWRRSSTRNRWWRSKPSSKPIFPFATIIRNASSTSIAGLGRHRSRRRFMEQKPGSLDQVSGVEAGTAADAAGLDALYGHLPAAGIIERSVTELFAGAIAGVSSFGADSAVLLHLIAQV